MSGASACSGLAAVTKDSGQTVELVDSYWIEVSATVDVKQHEVSPDSLAPEEVV